MKNIFLREPKEKLWKQISYVIKQTVLKLVTLTSETSLPTYRNNFNGCLRSVNKINLKIESKQAEVKIATTKMI